MALATVEEKKDREEEEAIVGDQFLVPYEPIPYQMKIVPHKLLALLLLHFCAVYALVTVQQLKWQTLVFALLVALCIALSVLVGAHRLWAHRSFTANLGLRLFLAFFFTMSFQESIYTWVRDHRAHHKWTDSDADPYNARRGFLFSHIGWIVLQRHPEVIRKAETIDMSDIEGDPILAFQSLLYYPLLFLIWGVLPTFIPVYFWNESVSTALLVVIYRTVLIHHITFLANSWAHWNGSQPYSKRFTAVESTLRHLLMGEGFHNYHHAFPWDYSASELGAGEVFNPATAFIDFCHWMGWANHLKRAERSLVEKKVNAAGGKDPSVKGNFAKEWIGGVLTNLAVALLAPLTISFILKRIVRAIV